MNKLYKYVEEKHNSDLEANYTELMKKVLYTFRQTETYRIWMSNGRDMRNRKEIILDWIESFPYQDLNKEFSNHELVELLNKDGN